jgi:hypothetical protein
VVLALREIAGGHVRFYTPDEERLFQKELAEKVAAEEIRRKQQEAVASTTVVETPSRPIDELDALFKSSPVNIISDDDNDDDEEDTLDEDSLIKSGIDINS